MAALLLDIVCDDFKKANSPEEYATRSLGKSKTKVYDIFSDPMGAMLSSEERDISTNQKSKPCAPTMISTANTKVK
jgi:hypothetical protein